MDKYYLCIDLKSFYASVECVERGLDPMTTNLVVADPSRTEKTICLAVTPSLKELGLSGRARLFEVVQRVKNVNQQRKRFAPDNKFAGASADAIQLKKDASLELSYITAMPRMAHYMEYSARIYEVYLKYVAPEDIHVYSIDEVFMDITKYLNIAKKTPREFAKEIILDVFKTTGITATAGIGTNLYLAKVAMDIVAKHVSGDKDGIRIAELDEMSYRRQLWEHRPLTDFWRVGKGYSKKLQENRLYTMGDIAKASLTDYGENLLYRLFGVNAELLIDHSWGWEPCAMADIKAYKPENNSIGSGQVLHCPYNYEKAKLIVREMTDLLVLDLVDKELVTDQIVLTIGYDIENLTNTQRAGAYKGEVTVDYYGRRVPKHAHGTVNIGRKTSSTQVIMEKVMELFEDIVDKNLLVRRVNIVANHIISEYDILEEEGYEQLDLFTDYEKIEEKKKQEKKYLKKERNLQKTIIDLKKRYGKNAVIKGNNLQDGATTIDRNNQIGGHKA